MKARPFFVLLALLASASTAHAAPFEVRCKEPLPTFTLGEKSSPTPAQVEALCACVWGKLKGWERETSVKIAERRESEVSFVHMRAFPARFGERLNECGGMKL